jgi:catechol 2,3-dioxygenase-like lactoylglutathione lyase family enzyme
MSDERPVLGKVNLVVRDMDAMVAFYARLGVEVPNAAPPWEQWDAHHRTLSQADELDFDLDSAAFAGQWNEGWPAGQGGAVLGFRFPTRAAVDATFADLVAAGYAAQQAPYDAFWGERYAVVVDPDGNSVGLASPLDPERRSDPPPPPD